MVRMLIAGSRPSVCVTALLARTPQQGPFQLSCTTTLPFETIKKDRDIDDVCDRAGPPAPTPNANRTAPRMSSAPAALLPWRRSFPSNDSRRRLKMRE